MKPIRLIVPTLCMALAALPLAHAGDLSVRVEGIERQQGTIRIGLFDEAAYAGDDAVAGAEIAVTSEAVETVFSDLAPGEYAIRLYHDLNDDGTLNTNAMGIPNEPYAFSNNAKGRFGPASWRTAHFTVPAGDSQHTITMK